MRRNNSKRAPPIPWALRDRISIIGDWARPQVPALGVLPLDSVLTALASLHFHRRARPSADVGLVAVALQRVP